MTRGTFVGAIGLFVLAMLTAGAARQAAPSGEELYVDRLGCWNCHGKGGGGDGGAKSIAKSALPLRRFIQYVRLPSNEMPPFSPMLASDAELAIVYRWLDGVDAVKTPPPVTIDLKASGTEAEVKITAAGTDRAALGYRVTLVSDSNTPVAGQKIECQLQGSEDWAPLTTDENGEARLSQGRALTGARLRTALPSGKYALVVEALDDTTPASPVVVGVGTAVLKVE